MRVTRRPGASDPDAAALALPPEGLTIGRSDECGLVLADPLRLVSRQHAKVDPDGVGARVRCLSGNTPLWVNDAELEPGNERALQVGDQLRIGRFELLVEPVATPAAAAGRSRLDRWFDLDDAPDLLGGEALDTAVVAAPEAPTSAVVSWQSAGHAVGSTVAAAPAATMDVAPVAAEAAPPAASPTPRVARAAAPTPRKPARRPTELPVDVQDLATAFARGAGLRPDAAALTPEWMEHIGALLRATAEGTLALLQSRAVTKRHMRAEGTHIEPRQNNPLKFSPDATEALTRMLQRDATPGFLEPVAALQDAHRDLLVHQVAMVAGMRAAVFELFSRLGPDAAESAEGPARGADRVRLLREAALWRRHCLQHAELLEHLDDDFEAIFGREFLRAYQAQSSAGGETPVAPPEAPWQGLR
nr:type VI secretion system-associated FHA domain protein TagH [Ramlibacter algicola]